jgi:hypothetical protein
VIPRTLPHIAELITYGEITVGVQHSVGCVLRGHIKSGQRWSLQNRPTKVAWD